MPKELDDIFGALPYGFSPFENVKDKLIDCRARLRLPENSCTVISVLFPYYLGEEYYENSNISRYAVSADYHIITKKITDRLVRELSKKYPENVFEPFVDNSPLPEVLCAVNAGLGFLGKNRLFISKTYGSWVFLGEIVTDRYFLPFNGAPSVCPGCGKCIKACPTGALSENGFAKSECLSFLTQKKGELAPEIAEKMAQNDCVWGCDICQKVCPMNINAQVTPIADFFETANPVVTDDTCVEGRAFEWRGKAVLKRNIIAAAEAEGRMNK